VVAVTEAVGAGLKSRGRTDEAKASTLLVMQRQIHRGGSTLRTPSRSLARGAAIVVSNSVDRKSSTRGASGSQRQNASNIGATARSTTWLNAHHD
jgi:hypothetical protein